MNRDLTESEKDAARHVCENWLNLYAPDPNFAEYYRELVANKANWRCGYDRQHDYCWVTPVAADGFYVRILMGATYRFRLSDLPAGKS